MKRVTGIGGIFFKCQDPETMRQWYEAHLGIKNEQYGTSFEWLDAEDPTKKGTTVWSAMKESTKYFDPSDKPFMINYRVENLEALLELLKNEGINIVGELEDSEYGKFAHILDPEGNKIELWEDKN